MEIKSLKFSDAESIDGDLHATSETRTSLETVDRTIRRDARRFNARVFLRLALIVLALIVSPLGVAQAAETVTYYYTSPQGTVLAAADSAGNFLTSADYRPYGGQALGTPEDGPGYAGHVNDADTGLVYMQARYYDPAVARFLSTDPASAHEGSLDQFNRFAYIKNNPASNIDPDGKESVSTMIDNGAEGCGAVSCAGWALLRAGYEVGSLGFSSVHDPMRDAYDAGAATQEDYVKIGVAGGAGVALSGIAIGEVGGKAVGAAVSRATKEGTP